MDANCKPNQTSKLRLNLCLNIIQIQFYDFFFFCLHICKIHSPILSLLSKEALKKIG